ncbi:MAG TPA: adenylyltransferase, partial [Vicinamibacteria bacterium]|nr:adenylyltransferase [Vicinamibacteria bacterium]
MNTHTALIQPVGGTLVDLLVSPEARADLRARANRLPSLQLSERALYDLELLATGGFSPLDRFMGEADFRQVVGEMRLASGQLFPIPVTLDVERPPAVKLDGEVALRDARNELLGIMTVEEAYEWDRAAMAQQVLGTRDVRHPLVAEMQRWGTVSLSGRLEILALPARHDFRDLRLTPAETRARLAELGVANVVAFQTRNPLHRAHEELTKRAAEAVAGTLLLHPVVGMTKPGDVDYYTRVRTYKVLVERYYERG